MSTTADAASINTSTSTASKKQKKKGSFRFGRSKKSAEGGDEPSSMAGAPVRKAKSFKRIRGFLTGESRRERKARKAAAKAANGGGGAAAADDDASTIYGVDVDERSLASAAVSAPPSPDKKQKDQLLGTPPKDSASVDDHEAFFAGSQVKKPYLLKVVLLLMDPNTRRFELLQLEFDSYKALVSDVLKQIHVSVTEEALRDQVYVGICGRAGTTMTPDKLLAEFCTGNDVLVAIPQGVTAKECARLAKPILSDDKVGAMLMSSGIDAKAWKDDASKSKKSKKKAVPSSLATGSATTKSKALPSPKEKSTTSSAGNKVITVLALVLVAIALQVLHLYISAPIRPGHVVSPGIWLVQCGLLAFWPGCDNAFLHVKKDGMVTLYNAQRQVAWEMQGGVCPELDDDSSKAAACKPGLHVQDDGSIVIGGKPVSWVTQYQEAPLSPWPFAQAPKLKVWKK